MTRKTLFVLSSSSQEAHDHLSRECAAEDSDPAWFSSPQINRRWDSDPKKQGYVLQKSPPEFFFQPDPMCPMNQSDFEHWLAILKEHFPDHARLKDVATRWHPGES